MAALYLTRADLADRWCLSIRTLERWEGAGLGPQPLRIGRNVRYRLADVRAFEAGLGPGG